MSQVTVLTGPERRRRWSEAERAAILAEAFAAEGVVADVARRFDISTSLIYRWRNLSRAPQGAGFSQVVVSEPAGRRESASSEPAILVEVGEARISISASAPAPLVTATLRALR
ncbi:MAG: transposase [Hyphomonadaceae bacterium]